jgi:hypothetical protein
MACGLACASLLVLSTAVSADAHKPSGHPTPAAGAASTNSSTSKCDVPGAACDPSKSDHDNGVGNNCDPGYGEGNQAKFAPDETTTGCRTKPADTESSESQKSEEQNQTPEQPNTPPAPVVAPCSTTTTVSHSDNESTTGSDHESNTAEMHDSGTETRTDSDSCTTTTTVTIPESSPLTITLTEKHEKVEQTVTITIEKLVVETQGNQVVLTITGLVNNETETFEVTLPANLTEISGLNLEELPGGGISLTLPNGTVLTFTGGVLSVNGTTVPTGTSLNVSGITITTAPGTPSGTVLGSSSSSPSSPATGVSGTTGGSSPLGIALGTTLGRVGLASAGTSLGNSLSGVAGEVESAANSATGVGLAATGLPILGGLVGLVLFLTGMAIRRRG